MGEGNEESESPSLCACVSLCVLSICLDISPRDGGSWRGGGAWVVGLAPDELLWSVGGLFTLPCRRLELTWFLWRLRPFMT